MDNIEFWRGTSFKFFAQNFHGDKFFNHNNSAYKDLYITTDKKMAKRYVGKSQMRGNATLCVLLRFEIPRDRVYATENYKEHGYEDVERMMQDIERKIEDGEQVILQPETGLEKYKTKFLKTKYLEHLEEFYAKGPKEKEGKTIKIRGSPKRVEQFIKSETS